MWLFPHQLPTSAWNLGANACLPFRSIEFAVMHLNRFQIMKPLPSSRQCVGLAPVCDPQPLTTTMNALCRPQGTLPYTVELELPRPTPPWNAGTSWPIVPYTAYSEAWA